MELRLQLRRNPNICKCGNSQGEQPNYLQSALAAVLLHGLQLRLPQPAATKSLILSVTIKTQIPLSRIADGDGSAKPGCIAVLHSQQGRKMLYHKFLNHKFLYHPPLPAGGTSQSAAWHLAGWSRIQNRFSLYHLGVGFSCY